MTRCASILLTLCLAFFIGIASTVTASDTTLKFSAKVLEKVVNGDKTVRIQLFSSSNITETDADDELTYLVWSNTKTISFTNSFFTVEMGNVKPLTPNIFVTHNKLYVDLYITEDSLTLPLLELHAAPYAFKAHHATTANYLVWDNVKNNEIANEKIDGLSELAIASNVELTNKSHNDFLLYNNTSEKWVNTQPSPLALLDNVTLTDPTQDDILIYRTNKWVNVDSAEIATQSNWEETNTNSVAYIKNKPFNFPTANVDDVTIEIDNNTLRVKNSGISQVKLADNSVLTAKINDDAVTAPKVSFISDTLAQTDTHLLIANGTEFTNVAMSGDATIANTGALTIANDAITTVKIADNQVTTAKIKDDAVSAPKINFISDTLAQTDTHLLIANGTEFANVAMSGDATIANTGALTIANNAITTVKIADDQVTAPKVSFISDTLAQTDTHLLIANGTEFTNVAMSGDATIANTGAITIANNAVTSAKIKDSEIVNDDLSAGDFTNIKNIGCPDGYTSVAGGRLCVGAISTGTFNAAETACRAVGARVCSFNDICQFCSTGPANGPFNFTEGWLSDIPEDDDDVWFLNQINDCSFIDTDRGLGNASFSSSKSYRCCL